MLTKKPTPESPLLTPYPEGQALGEGAFVVYYIPLAVMSACLVAQAASL